MRSLCFLLICLFSISAQADSRAGDDVLAGFVEVIIEDYLREDSRGQTPTQFSITRYYLEVDGERIELTGKELPDVRTGEHLRLEGRHEGDTFRVERVVSVGPGKLNGKAAGRFSGPQNLIVIPIELQNAGFAPSCDWDRINDLAIEGPTSMTNWWDEVSFGNLYFDPEVSFTHPVVTIPSSFTGVCDLTTWTAQANAEVEFTTNLNLYNRRVYVIPNSLSECPLGLGQVGNPAMPVTLNWVRGCNFPDTFQHEMGHNFSLRHANTPAQEYGDTGDIMGFATGIIRKINGPHVEDLGWLDQTLPYYKTLSGVGVYEEELLALGRDYVETPMTQILKIPAPSLGGQSLYVSYRDRHGMDASLPVAYDFETHVHLSNEGTGSILRATLGNNQSFTLPVDGITIRQLSNNTASGTAQVRVTIETPTDCVEMVPTVRLVSQDPLFTAPGGSVDYQIEVTNNDGPTCNPVDFLVTSTLPNTSWSSNAPVLLTLEPGQTELAPALTITSPESATSPRYLLTMAVIVTADTEGEHTALLRDVEFKTDAFPPSTPTLSVDLVDGDPMLAWSESTDTQSGVSYYEVYRSAGNLDFAKTGETTETTAADTTADPSPMIWYKVIAVDNVGNKSD